MNLKYSIITFMGALSLTTSAVADDGIYYSGTVDIKQLTVSKNGNLKTYQVNLINLYDETKPPTFHLWPEGQLVLGDISRCPPYIGDLEKDLELKANITEVYRLQGEYATRKDKDGYESFEREKVPAGATGEGKLIVPKGSTVHGTCSARDSNVLTEVMFTPKRGDAVRVKINRCPYLSPEEYHLSSESCMILPD